MPNFVFYYYSPIRSFPEEEKKNQVDSQHMRNYVILFVRTKATCFNRRSSVLKAKDQKLLKNESRAHPGT